MLFMCVCVDVTGITDSCSPCCSPQHQEDCDRVWLVVVEWRGSDGDDQSTVGRRFKSGGGYE